MATVIERVRAGATLLDMHVVGWAEQINVDRLVMNDCIGCILGQTFELYSRGCRQLGITFGWNSQAAACGFHAESEIPSEQYNKLSRDARIANVCRVTAEYAALRSAWLAEIALRLEPETAIDETELSPVATYDSPL